MTKVKKANIQTENGTAGFCDLDTLRFLAVAASLLLAAVSPARAGMQDDLAMAASFQKVDAVRAALSNNADPNAPSGGFLPLEWACKDMPRNSADGRAVIRLLLQAGADPNRMSPSGAPPLHLSRGNAACIEELLAGGADPDIRSDPSTSTCPFAPTPALERILSWYKTEDVANGVQALLDGGADAGIRGCDGNSMHAIIAGMFLRKIDRLEKSSPPAAGWWRPYVTIWQALDRKAMADAAAQDMMIDALQRARMIEMNAH
ncbi:ankyrin repeat domain-containing protein [Rhodospirillaceae bacterium KN72]|uniref:Ankyrin repeat domain-containing protein n=1 Tax=Pacificispira spongiicola TaxID=2729598 RepID=A0A7Y0HDE7_9PROT|nr:ankyrin repeat domain-containing protein [Pacificispira spongiicola]NMM43595.1 ankyrin repeat domain-containing protein [Pacificispira spongiicola]